MLLILLALKTVIDLIVVSSQTGQKLFLNRQVQKLEQLLLVLLANCDAFAKRRTLEYFQ